MKLINSLLITAGIVAAVWSLALLQPAKAKTLEGSQTTFTAMKETQGKQLSVAKSNHAIAKNQITIAGKTQTLPIEQVSQLWQSFNQDVSLNASLVKQPNVVYVLYRDFSNNFDIANVTIGYSVDALANVKQPIVIPSSRYQPLLSKRKYSDQELANAWQTIDYRKALSHVLEIHYLSPNNTVLRSEVLVNYLGDK